MDTRLLYLIGLLCLIIICIWSFTVSLSNMTEFTSKTKHLRHGDNSSFHLANTTSSKQHNPNESFLSVLIPSTTAPSSIAPLTTIPSTIAPLTTVPLTTVPVTLPVLPSTTPATAAPIVVDIKYPNIAIQDLYEQQDALLLRAKKFYAQLDTDSEMRNKYAQKEPLESANQTKSICLVVMAANRIVPYIDLLAYMLSQKQTYEEIFSLAEVHVMNIEQRSEQKDISYLHNVQRFGFIKLHDFAKDHIAPGDAYLYSQRRAGRRTLQICKESKADWCVVMEDDALPPARFFPLFKQHVIEPLRGKEGLYSFIRLFDPFIDELMKGNTGRNIHDSNWVDSWYRNYRSQKREKDLTKATFRIRDSGITYGGVAIAYPKIAYQEVLDTYASFDLKTTTEPNDVIIGLHHSNRIHKPKGTIDPSLVTHVGLKSEQDQTAQKFSRIFADLRFQTNLDS